MPEKPIIINDFSLGMCISHLGKLVVAMKILHVMCVITHKLYIPSPVIYSNNLTSVFKFEVKKKKLFFNFFAEYMHYGKFNARHVGSDFN